MIPIELTVQGLYSYQARQTIDFTRLTAANLFGIFGPVGSGKSSILEAITFSIYGRTDRLNLSGDNRYYNMMNLRSNELLIDFIFETGKEQTAYRATVKSNRNSRNFDDVRTPERAAYQQIDGEWIPIPVDALEAAIGLSYDNFKRTIIIPQGQFQEFLQLGNKDRTKMMKELFNLEKYEFFYKVVSLEKKNDKERQTIKGQLQQLGEVDPCQIEEYSRKLLQLEKELEELNRKLTADQQKEEELRKLQELTEKQENTQKEYAELLEKKDHFQALHKKIIRYEQAVIGFKHLLESLKTTEQKVTLREEQIRTDTEKFSVENREIERLDKMLEELKPAYEKREGLKKKSEELDRMLAIKDTEKQIKLEQERLTKGTKIWNETVQEWEEAKVKKTGQDETIKWLRDKMPDLALLSTIRAWYSEKANIQRQLRECNEELKKYARQWEEQKQEKSKLIADPIFKTFSTETPPLFEPLVEIAYSDIFNHLAGEEEMVKELQRSLSVLENHLRVKKQLQAYSEALEENQPCPLCGSLHHPERYSSEDIGEELKKVVLQKQAHEKKLAHIASLNREFTLLESRQIETSRQQNEWNRKSQGVEEINRAHDRLFVWDSYRQVETLNNAFDTAKTIQETLKKEETILQELIKKVENKERNKERFQEELQKIKTSIVIHQSKLETLEQQLTLIKRNEYQNTSVPSIEKEKEQLLDEHQQLEKKYNDTTRWLKDREKRRDRLNGVIEVNQRELKQEQATVVSLQTQLSEQLEKSTFQSLEEVALLLSESLDIDSEKQKVENFNEQLLRLKSTLEQLQKDMAERIYDAEIHEEVNHSIRSCKEEIHQNTQEQGKIAVQLKTLRKELENRLQLQTVLEKLDTRAENIRTMKSLFKASGFVNYVSSVYLQNLCNAANDRFFQLTRQQLSLEITEDNNFQVRDFLNGGKVRSVKTLSGGQTFQASLSLALALADNIQQITQSHQNFFFLDEGFGSLDKESLNIVFDTLKSLRKENRVVGVISHVEEMQQEIDEHLRVENDPERGTLIYRSWEG